ncbi:MAG TPA: hypothetical protein VJN93_18105 [Candidatus Acidoferrum sp.]|nr:hypothetical protein [Candidatus Acidoferrum sp.]
MQCKDIELVLEQEGLDPLPEEARAHLAECRECRSYVADLTSLVDAAKKLPSEVAPPDRVWISLRAQLEQEGIIRTVVQPPAEKQAGFLGAIREFFRSRALVTGMVGILIVAATVFQIRRDRTAFIPTPIQTVNQAPEPARAKVTPAPPTTTSAARQDAPVFASAARALDDQEPVATGMILASSSPVDVSLRDNLKKVDEFIADCEQHLKEQPNDELTQEYLSAAYEQKAELLSAMIERGRSTN